jgi:uncharacterized Ntn-hydrolase superfamily protein
MPIPFALRSTSIALLIALTIAEAGATWSIAAIHPRTQTIGVAAASCSGGVFGIQSVLSGVGVVIVQAESNADARREAVALLRDRKPLDAILARLTDPQSGFVPERQQFAVLAVGSTQHPRTYTGADTPDVHADLSGEHFSVQGNTLASTEVVPKTVAALGTPDWPDDLAMARALMRALQAGATAGGDRRCGSAASNSAFISLHRAHDPQDAPWLTLAVNRTAVGESSATDALAKLFTHWQREDMARSSTVTFVVPAAHEAAKPRE